MNPQLPALLTAISATAAGALLSAIWQGAMLTAAVALALRFAKGITAAVRSLLWMATFALVILLHLIPLMRGATPMHSSGSVPAHALHVDARWSLAIAALWLAVAVFRLAQLGRSWITLRRIARAARPLEGARLDPTLLRAGRRSARLCVSGDVDRPSVLGFFAPRVLIPAELARQLSPAELEHIVLHEMEHLRRRDDWTNLFQKLALALFPLNPAMLWVERRLSLERELACDDHVLARTRARKTYATCLVNLAEHSMIRRRLSLALGAWERRSELARRVLRILHPGEGTMSGRRLRFVTAALVAAMLGGTIELAREPRLIAFIPKPAAVTQADAVDTVLPGAPSYLPAAAHESVQPRAVNAVFQLPTSGTTAAAPKAVRSKPHPAKLRSLEAVLQAPPRIAAPLRQLELAQAEPPAEMALPDNLAGRPSRQVRAVDTEPGAVVVLTTFYAERLPANAPSAPDAGRQRVHLLIAHPVPSYAAIATPDGWLILQL